jgi:U32 family peptidase
MKIISGISSANSGEEIKSYVNAGVDEFFIGYVPPAWSELYGFEISCNRREHAAYNYQSIQEIETVVDLIHKANRKVYLALNAHEYTAEQIKLLTHILDDVRHVKFDAFIISNIALMLELRDKRWELPFNVSIGGGANNAEAVLFYNKQIQNIGRVVLPRKLTLSEVENISNKLANTGISLEAFGLADACFFNDEYCFPWHSSTIKSLCQSPMYKHRTASPILMGTQWKQELKPENYPKLAQRKISIENEISNEQQEYEKKYKRQQKLSGNLELLPLLTRINKCGLCAIQKFKEFGVDAIKLPLRGGNIQANIEIIRLVKKVIDKDPATPAFCQSLFSSTTFCNGSNCYYNYPFEN